MNSVERVKLLCKERRIPISKLEKDLGFGNGYIGQLKKGVFPADRFSEIAKYLSVSEEFLLTGSEPQKTPAPEGGREVSDRDIMFALWGDTSDVDEDDLADVKRYAAFIRDRKKQK